MRCACIYLVVKAGILNMYLFRIDAYDRTVLLVQLSDFPYVLTGKDDIIVKLIPVFWFPLSIGGLAKNGFVS
jgi:hypothetical protein